MNRIFSTLLVSFCLSLLNVKGTSNSDSTIYERVDFSYAIGGQIYNDNFIYNPGASAQLTYGLMLNSKVGVGIGVGYQEHKRERFLPVCIEVLGYTKDKKNTPVIKMQLGYAVGWYNGGINMEGYKYRGGIFLSAGLGRKIRINDDLSIFFHWSYKHQFAKMEYKIFNTDKYSERLNYDMLVISLGLIREQ